MDTEPGVTPPSGVIPYLEPNCLIQGDCLLLMLEVRARTVSLTLADLPYSKTDCEWDEPVDLVRLWRQLRTVQKPNAVACFNAVQPFTTRLVNANERDFHYTYCWVKRQAANFQLAKKMPLKKHEDVLVFYRGRPTYHPQMRRGPMKAKRIGPEVYQARKTECFLASRPANLTAVKSDLYFPTTILDIPGVPRNQSLHRTQKPVELFEFLIRTYTDPGDLVFDPCAGVGSSARGQAAASSALRKAPPSTKSPCATFRPRPQDS
jgi:site-specific DNA-methyltransferase (adenine-specific)